MRIATRYSVALLSTMALAACDNGAKQQLATLAHTDSIRVDSLAGVRRELMDEVMQSTQFVAQINTELAKARTLASKTTKLETTGETKQANVDRKAIVARISQLVAKLDSVQVATREHACPARSSCRRRTRRSCCRWRPMRRALPTSSGGREAAQ